MVGQIVRECFDSRRGFSSQRFLMVLIPGHRFPSTYAVVSSLDLNPKLRVLMAHIAWGVASNNSNDVHMIRVDFSGLSRQAFCSNLLDVRNTHEELKYQSQLTA